MVWFDYIYNNDLSPYIKIETIYFFYWLFKFAELRHREVVQLFLFKPKNKVKSAHSINIWLTR